jgi:hypothetical protein
VISPANQAFKYFHNRFKSFYLTDIIPMNFKQFAILAFKSVFLIIMAFTVLFWFPSCKDDPIEYQLDRASAFSFRLDTFALVTTNDVKFYIGPSVLHNFGDTAQVLFQRISLQAHGLTPSSKEYWFIVDFDTHLDGNAVGTYSTIYDSVNGGINDMRLIIDNDGLYVEYKAIQQLNTVLFQVDAQREEERIMKGIFGGFLYKDGDPENQAAVISNGVFKDIYY